MEQQYGRCCPAVVVPSVAVRVRFPVVPILPDAFFFVLSSSLPSLLLGKTTSSFFIRVSRIGRPEEDTTGAVLRVILGVEDVKGFLLAKACTILAF